MFDGDGACPMITEQALLEMASGKLVDVCDLKWDDVSLRDITHNLGNLCRFAGACSRFYSVAEHSLHVGYFLRHDQGITDRSILMGGLLHDASEALIADVPMPVKRLRALDGYMELEDQIMRMLASVFHFMWPLHDAVTEADRIVGTMEAHTLMPSHGLTWPWWKERGAPVIQRFYTARWREVLSADCFGGEAGHYLHREVETIQYPTPPDYEQE